MSTVQEIEAAVVRLPPNEFEQFRAWLREYESTAFDRQIEADAKSGKLDFLIDEVEVDVRHARLQPR